MDIERYRHPFWPSVLSPHVANLGDFGIAKLGFLSILWILAGCWSVWQLDPVRVFLFPLVLFGKNLFEPMRLTVSDRLIHERARMTDDEVFAAYVAPQDPHRLKISSRLVSRLLFLYCHCLHLLDFSD